MNFDNLPLELVIDILSRLSLQDLLSANSVSSLFHRVAATLIDHKMMEHHFPHHYIPHVLDKTVNYKDQFLQAATQDYQHTVHIRMFDSIHKPFTPQQIAIFHACKTGDTKLFLKHFNTVCKVQRNLEALVMLTDQTNRNFFQWAGYFGHQAILDAAFAVLSKPYTGRNNHYDFHASHYGVRLLTLAVFCNQLEMIRQLSDEALLLTDANTPGIVALATSCCHLELIDYLVKQRPFTVPNPEVAKYPAHYACAFGNLAMARFWISKAPDDVENLMMMFKGAIDCNNTVSLKHLLDLSCNINETVEENQVRIGTIVVGFNHAHIYNPIKSAVYHKKIKLALMMLMVENCRANTLLSDTVYQNPYQFNAALNKLLADSIFRTVKDFYKNVNGTYDCAKVDEYGNSLLHWIAYCDQTDLLQGLDIADPGLFAQPNKSRQTPAQLASLCAHLGVMQQLVHKGFDINATGDYSSTSLHTACRYGHAELVRFLLTCPAIDVDKRNGHNSTPLREACEHGYYDIAVMLVNSGADINRGNSLDNSPLSSAAEKGHVEIVRFLLGCPGINTESTTPNGYTALDYARINRHHDCVELLKPGRVSRCVIC